MNKAILITILLSGFFVMAVPAYACEPCNEIWDVEKTSQESDAIIIGQRTDYSPDELNDELGGPGSVTVKVLDVLKGSVEAGDEISVHAWSAMCPYGITVDDSIYVMMLVENQYRDHVYEYDSVNNGCSAKTFFVQDGLIDFEGDRLSPTEFRTKLGLGSLNATKDVVHVSPEIVDLADISSQNSFPATQDDNNLYFIILAAAIIMVAVVLVYLRRKPSDT